MPVKTRYAKFIYKINIPKWFRNIWKWSDLEIFEIEIEIFINQLGIIINQLRIYENELVIFLNELVIFINELEIFEYTIKVQKCVPYYGALAQSGTTTHTQGGPIWDGPKTDIFSLGLWWLPMPLVRLFTKTQNMSRQIRRGSPRNGPPQPARYINPQH